MALNEDELKELEPEQLVASLIEYSVALDASNEQITSLNLTNAESVKTIDSLNEIGTKDKADIKKLRADLKKVKADLKSQVDLVELAESSSSEDSTDRNTEIVTRLENEILDYKKQIAKLEKDSKALPKTSVELGAKTKLHTYNIKGYDNKTGLSIHGGNEYMKGLIILKLEDNVLSWEIKSPDLNLNILRDLTLTPEEVEKLNTEIDEHGSYFAIKSFLDIPDKIENTFSDLIMNGRA